MTEPDDYEMFKYFLPIAPVPDWKATPVLTKEMLRAAIEKVRTDSQPRRCGNHDMHVVHPAEFERGGWACCANCGAAVYLGDGQ